MNHVAGVGSKQILCYAIINTVRFTVSLCSYQYEAFHMRTVQVSQSSTGQCSSHRSTRTCAFFTTVVSCEVSGMNRTSMVNKVKGVNRVSMVNKVSGVNMVIKV